MSIAYNTSLVTDELTTYIDFANSKSSPKTGTSPVTITDLSNNKINWTTQNTCTINSDNISLDGNSGYLVSGTGTTGYDNAWSPVSSSMGYGQPSVTFELIFNSSDTAGNLLSRPWNGSGQYNYQMTPTSFHLHIGSTTTSVSYSNICTGSLVHMVWWVNATQMGVYKNGVEYVAATAHNLSGYGATSGTNQFGTVIGSLYPYGQGWAGATNFSISGNFYLFRLYKKQLSGNEIRRNFNATRGRYGL